MFCFVSKIVAQDFLCRKDPHYLKRMIKADIKEWRINVLAIDRYVKHTSNYISLWLDFNAELELRKDEEKTMMWSVLLKVKAYRGRNSPVCIRPA